MWERGQFIRCLTRTNMNRQIRSTRNKQYEPGSQRVDIFETELQVFGSTTPLNPGLVSVVVNSMC